MCGRQGNPDMKTALPFTWLVRQFVGLPKHKSLHTQAQQQGYRPLALSSSITKRLRLLPSKSLESIAEYAITGVRNRISSLQTWLYCHYMALTVTECHEQSN